MAYRVRKTATARFFILLILTLIPSVARAQTETQIFDLAAEHTFGERFSFSAGLESDLLVDTADVTFKSRSNGSSKVIPAQLDVFNQLSAEYEIDTNDYFPPFSIIEFWFSIELSDGSQIESEVSTFVYEDNRYDWQSLSANGDYKIFWADGDRALGQAAADSIQENFDTYNQYLDLPTPETLRVYIYPTASALQSALDITHARWVAGHADPVTSTILVSVPSGFDQNLEIQRQIPHEVVHVRLFLYLQEDYINLPAWYSEGLASLGERFSSTDYWPVLQAGWEDEQLIPMAKLCQNFPSESDDAALAYAQADSFTHYLYETYGKIGLQSLLDAYKAGHTCQNGVSSALDIELSVLEEEWKQATFRNNIFSPSENPIITWIVLAVFLLITPIIYVTILLFRSDKKEE